MSALVDFMHTPIAPALPLALPRDSDDEELLSLLSGTSAAASFRLTLHSQLPSLAPPRTQLRADMPESNPAAQVAQHVPQRMRVRSMPPPSRLLLYQSLVQSHSSTQSSRNHWTCARQRLYSCTLESSYASVFHPSCYARSCTTSHFLSPGVLHRARQPTSYLRLAYAARHQ